MIYDLHWYIGPAVLVGSFAAWEGPQLLLAKVKNASGRIGIYFYIYGSHLGQVRAKSIFLEPYGNYPEIYLDADVNYLK